MSKLVLVRHGESQWNLENRFTGWIDVPLSQKGIEEAKSCGEKLKNYKFAKAFTSKLIRANKTLEIILEIINQQKIQIEYSVALNERHYGALQGLNKNEMIEKFGAEQVKIWRRSFDVPPPSHVTEFNPDGKSESLKDTAARTLPYFEKEILTEIQNGNDIIVVAHGNSLRSIVMKLNNLSKEEVLELNIPTGVPYIFEFDSNGQKISSYYI
ncbi:MAG: 2,3-bisphosphoglycerate-dependent phosphoglycerate mutase [Bacteroidetes bacterium]|nr:2,3-bisphosphoglycerate-dependent phosphoglycerate mutase [Bacteroidota bacterium]